MPPLSALAGASENIADFPLACLSAAPFFQRHFPAMPVIRINNATIVNEGRRFTGDVLLSGGRIAAVGTVPARAPRPEREIDASGMLLLPGLIDDQVHFREPGLTAKADIASESRAAVAGGVTSFMDMPNTRPPAVTCAALEEKFAVAAHVSPANYSFYLGATNDNLAEVEQADPATICGIKVFMGSSTGNMLVDEPAALEKIFSHAPMLVATHCEDTPLIQANEAAALARYGADVPPAEHPRIRSAEACWRSSSLAVALAKKHGARLHVLHITTERELELFREDVGNGTARRITAEACVHHLWFCDADYAHLGHQIKCNPAIKTAADRAALRRAVNADIIDVIATDHAPHTFAEKQGTYFHAPSGLPLVQHSLPLLLELWRQGVFELETIVRKTSHAVADLFAIRERGYIREGYWADLVLVAPDAPQAVVKENIYYKCGWSPLEGQVFASRVVATFVNGETVFENGVFSSGSGGTSGGSVA
ncbi:MAG: dihydroorotase, partial [Puniceicoccales bacterium]|nr:dihydroorotase [Puniceicoccales bacterium]